MLNTVIGGTIRRHIGLLLSLGFLGTGMFHQVEAIAASVNQVDVDSGPLHGRYLIMFGSQGYLNTPSRSHTWATVVSIAEDGSVAEDTISWLPAEGYFGPDYTMPLALAVPGRNYDLDQTLERAKNRRIRYWGPYRVSDGFHESFIARKQELESGAFDYKMLITDPANRSFLSNCIIAVSETLGHLSTGTKYGFNASLAVLEFFAGEIIDVPARSHHNVVQMIGLDERIRSGTAEGNGRRLLQR